MKAQKLWRQVHHWGSLLIMLPFGVVVISGLFLMLKKDITWIQPPTQAGVAASAVPALSFEELFAAAQKVEELDLENWRSLQRVDVKPGDGIVKFVAANNWEAQIDTETGEVLQVAYRRSDIIESLHDGSFFGDGAKRFIFLPGGIVMLVLWGTGVYLFVLPYIVRAQKRRRQAAAGHNKAQS